MRIFRIEDTAIDGVRVGSTGCRTAELELAAGIFHGCRRWEKSKLKKMGGSRESESESFRSSSSNDIIESQFLLLCRFMSILS
mmetsp:Transcript_39174/g.71771  ORF Transcript_39174/g.71771 Transcript_39174/m.71771 type:complete len:83 (+) Transcript_39174:317-565(+)